MLTADYHAGNWDEIFRVIKNYEVFQDEPFNQASDAFIAEIQKRYPDARFILSTRDNATEWFHSLLRFSRKKWAWKKIPIRWDDVKKVEYGKKDDYFQRYLRYRQEAKAIPRRPSFQCIDEEGKCDENGLISMPNLNYTNATESVQRAI